MKKQNIVVLFLTIALVILLGILAVVLFWPKTEAVTDSGSCGENLTWQLHGNSFLTISGSGDMTDFDEEEAPWAAYGENITEVVIYDGATTIGNHAFSECRALSGIILPDSIVEIGDYAFYNCTNLVLMSGTDIPEGSTVVFQGDSTNIEIPQEMYGCTIPQRVTAIGQYAFYHCTGLTGITIPANVKTIGDCAFGACENLERLSVAQENSTYYSEDNCIIQTADKTLVAGCKTSRIPSDGSVTAIGDYAFCGCTGLTEIAIPTGITTIGTNAFAYCTGLDVVSIPTSVVRIADGAFWCCSALNQVIIPTSVQHIGSRAWANCTSLSQVFYCGSTQEWAKIAPSNEETDLSGAAVTCDFVQTVIERQPEKACVLTGLMTKFTVVVSGNGLSYQWQYRTSSTGKWKDSAASTANLATVKIRGEAGRNGYQYRCRITDRNGFVSYSNIGELCVLQITRQPQTQWVTGDMRVQFSVEATGDGLSYQWEYQPRYSSVWKDSTASTANTKDLTVNATDVRDGRKYRCKITDSAGNVTYSDPAAMYVLSITTQPESVHVYAGNMAEFKVEATGDGVTYCWQYRTSATGEWKDSGAPNAKKPAVQIAALAHRNGYEYRCVITDSAGNVVYSDSATLHIG